MGGTTNTTQAAQQNKVELPAWVNEASMANYDFAKQVADRPLQQYQGSRVADPSAMTTQGYGMLTSGAGAENPMFADAASMFKSSAGDLDINKYLNPYTNEVEQRAIGNANTALTQQLGNIASDAQKAGTFGGTRFGVQQGVAQAEGVRGIGDLTASLRKQGFDTAAALAQGQKARESGAAQGLLSTAGGQQGARLSDAGALLGAGQQDTGSRQKVIDAAMQKFSEMTGYPVEQLNIRLAALGMSPYGKTETGTKTSSTETPMDWATTGLGVLKALPALAAMSDRRTKTDIMKVSGGEIPMYAYRYKGDPKTYPKVVGPMAQDIEKKYPSAIKKVGKYKTVDLNNLMEVLS